MGVGADTVPCKPIESGYLKFAYFGYVAGKCEDSEDPYGLLEAKLYINRKEAPKTMINFTKQGQKFAHSNRLTLSKRDFVPAPKCSQDTCRAYFNVEISHQLAYYSFEPEIDIAIFIADHFPPAASGLRAGHQHLPPVAVSKNEPHSPPTALEKSRPHVHRVDLHPTICNWSNIK